jgi:serine protease AprX
MAAKRVVAYAFNDAELRQIKSHIKNAQFTESFAIGDLDDGQISDLKAKGILIENAAGAEPSMAAKPDPVQLGLWQSVKRIFTGPLTVSPQPRGWPSRTKGGGPRPTNVSPLNPDSTYTFLIKLEGPLIDDWRHKLEQLDVRLIERHEGMSYTTRLKFDQVHSVRGLSFVQEVKIFGPEDTEVKLTTKSLAERDMAEEEWSLRLHDPDDFAEVERWLNVQQVPITASSAGKIRIRLPSTSKLIDEIPHLPGVAQVEQYVPPQLYNDVASLIIGIPATGQPRITSPELSGLDQIVGIADTGLDQTHPDFEAHRVVKVIARGRKGDASDANGHGTHVSGSVLGSGFSSQGRFRGTAPAARLVFQSVLDGSGRLGGLPTDLGEMFEEAYNLGARIHNNSWGANTEAYYTFNSREVDAFVDKQRDMLVVIAAGNEGTAATTNNPNKKNGVVDWGSMSSPATAKNALTVGACRSSRQEGGLASRSYGDVWPSKFQDPPIKTDRISGDPQEIAGFSSRGPCDDLRIKPDLVAPGTDILSTRSALAPDSNYWGNYEANNKYAYMGGTSMATPLVSGCAALVREYYTRTRHIEPSAALIKATLINGTFWMPGTGALADHDKMANFHQGFGRIDMRTTLAGDAASSVRLAFADDWKDEAQRLRITGKKTKYYFRLSGGQPLRICLAWTDPPGRGLQNSLGLMLEHQQSRTRWLGNQDVPDRVFVGFDRNNNVQVIRMPQAPEGEYVIYIVACNLVRPGQDFALVLLGALGNGDLTGLS